MKNVACILGGKVSNIIVADDEFIAAFSKTEQAKHLTFVDATRDVQIGWTWDGTKFVDPNAPSEQGAS